jgi:hypothetical protein
MGGDDGWEEINCGQEIRPTEYYYWRVSIFFLLICTFSFPFLFFQFSSWMYLVYSVDHLLSFAWHQPELTSLSWVTRIGGLLMV